MQVDSKPEELDDIDREIVQLKIEREALKKETDAASKDRLAAPREGDCRARGAVRPRITARWKAEKDKLGRAAELKKKLDEARNELANAQRQGDVPARRRARLRRHPGAREEAAPRPRRRPMARGMVEEAVTPDHIAGVVSRWTGMPVDKMLEGEREKLLHMEERSREARRRPARGGRGGLDGGAARARRPAGPEPADRLVHVPRARPASARPS